MLDWVIVGASVVPWASLTSRPEEATCANCPGPAVLMLMDACPCPFIAIDGIQ